MVTTDTARSTGCVVDVPSTDPTVAMLLAACDEELAGARAMAHASAVAIARSGRHDTAVDSTYSRAGFACGGRRVLAVIVGDGIHAPRASTAVQLRYDGWATVAEQAGLGRLAGELRRYVARHDGPDSLLVPEAIAYLEGARRIIAAT